MSGRKNFLVAVWAAFGVFWAFLAVETARNPVLEPERGPPLILILQIAMVALCGLVVVRVIRRWNAGLDPSRNALRAKRDLLGNPSEGLQHRRRRIDEPKGYFPRPLVPSHQLEPNRKSPGDPKDVEEARGGGPYRRMRVAVRDQEAAQRPIHRLVLGPEKGHLPTRRPAPLLNSSLFDARRARNRGLRRRDDLGRYGRILLAHVSHPIAAQCGDPVPLTDLRPVR